MRREAFSVSVGKTFLACLYFDFPGFSPLLADAHHHQQDADDGHAH